MMTTHGRSNVMAVMALMLGLAGAALGQSDPYEQYVKTSRDFQPVNHDKAFLTKQFPSWTYMPWYYQWTIGHDDAAGAFCQAHGINGAFLDRGGTGYLDWVNKYQLRFYMDHTAGKGDLHQWDTFPKDKANQIHGTGVRLKPVDDAMKTKLEGLIQKHIAAVKSSPMRGAYALDDEISWGHFIHPCMWQVTDNAAAYPAWLKEIYGPQAPARQGWISFNDVWPKLPQWSVSTFDASQLMDQWTFNDSYWNNFIGDLVSYANSVDPSVPCGFVGGQCPNAFGGFDYAKVMRKIQYLEAYNMANVQSIIRSFNPHNGMPTVTSFFYKDVDDAVWQAWYYLAEGNRGHIAWVEKWFNEDKSPKPWLDTLAPTYKECSQKIGPLMSGAEFKSDGVMLYYSQASIQLGWIFDAAAHGKTWTARNNDHKLGASHQVRNAWCNMLRDEGIQFTWLSYVDLIQTGVPAGTKVLILPATLCLSDVEARQIKAFCQAGGTVIADYLPGVWDQHGKGRPDGGALDDLFGVKHDPKMTSKSVFQGDGKLWCEVNQDAHFSYKTFDDFLGNNSCIKDASGFNKAVRAMDTAHVSKAGKGTAMLMNLSPQWYNAYRTAGQAEAAKRSVFMKPIHDAGVQRWVQVKNAGDKEFGYEITAWTNDTRTILFLLANKEVSASSAGGGAATGLQSDTIPVTLAFAKEMKNVKDERAGKTLGDGREFPMQWKRNEACVVSFNTTN